MLQFNFHPFPELITERLILRQITDADIPFVFSCRTDEEVMRYLDKPIPQSEEDLKPMFNKMAEDWEANRAVSWLIMLKETSEPVGQIGYWRIDAENHRAEVGYVLSSALFGKKLGSEALSAVLKYGFDQLHFHSIEANVNPANTASIRILEKHGFVREAYFRENYFFNGQFLDSAIYSILASDKMRE